MEKSHLNKLRQKYPEAMQGKQIVTLLIPDDYELMQPELVEDLWAKVAEYVQLP
jgi:protein-tyrosine phosphatase